MILKKIEESMVVSAVEIKSFHVEVDEDNKATITVILDDIHNSEKIYQQAPGDHHIYQIVDDNNTIIRLIHQ
jgi:hypothetical protein